VIDIDQSPIGRTPRSNPATYTGAFTPIRDWFAGTCPKPSARGYGPGRFSFNVKGGRCEACEGDGVIKIEMHFLPDVYVHLRRLQGQALQPRDARDRVQGQEHRRRARHDGRGRYELSRRCRRSARSSRRSTDVGLGYIHIGQSATTLSGGEAQRIKLAKELSRRATGRTLYILDEPTTGLHFDDIKKLLEVLHAWSIRATRSWSSSTISK
jgi:excinuclease ABC subunit A